MFLILLLSLSSSLSADPIYLSGDEAITDLQLVPVDPPPDFFKSSLPNEESPLKWYRLDIELSPYSPHDWLMVFRQVPHKKLDVFLPVNNGYQLKKMGIDGSLSGSAPNTIKLELKPGETKTWYIRHDQIALNSLNPELWPSLNYYETLNEQQTATSSIQTLLIVTLIFIFMTLRKRTPTLYLLISHMLATNMMILMWEGDIFHTVSWLVGDPGHWLILMTALVLVTSIISYRSLALLPIHTPKTDRLIISLSTVGMALVIYGITSEITTSEATIKLAGYALLASFTLVVLATAYCLYNGIRPAKITLPSALAMLLLLSWSWYTDAWPRSLPTYPELILLSFHAALLPLFYWHGHQQNLHHRMSVNAIAPTNRKRRIFETALREHLQNPDSPLSDNDMIQRVLATFEDVLPRVPAMVLCHQQDEWHFSLGETTDYSKTADNLAQQLPDIGDDLLSVISSGTETKINFKDQFGTIYWVFPLSIDAGNKVLMVLAPSRHHRNAITWQTASDISNHTCTLFQANRQSLFWQQQARLDPLTGLLNRRAFCQEAEPIIQAFLKQDAIQPCCALFIDIDNFKQLNDQQGHNAGDQILKTTALSCRKSLRHQDILGRYGGEEFVALLPNTKPWQAFRVAERMRIAIASEHAKNNQWTNCQPTTVSIGISALSGDVNSLGRIIEEADTAMYQAKQKGKNRTSISTSLNDVRIPQP
ncbi:diguanylate cyclase [Endozoicomonas sp. SCSIO W0465]|uniref:sensor domain-containing diguanylate cyclase n=1 Tax=Endozoicomonas sp. SCSIO W0465 TaxID=2918516 RepID=UPI002074E8A2|nr:diguanylate cyclase [Endozoicomonas sp. SCSIO W0465]USE34039.1 GGDEF domain-containing protein [Endozoicomonas sp. SCSIO W0465]